jgi:hypothetical protein|uniref:Uncharacterized protein n=1 Tax=Myoviridae sp. ctRci5 TaxID=2825105 RepID=A0A8S5V6G2_9CAUD|nr:MAG TPA: hypothetical protein [Myoviridae sp. ctRci5]
MSTEKKNRPYNNAQHDNIAANASCDEMKETP